MGVLRTRTGPVGRPFAKGNRGGGRKKGVPNKATQEIKEFARNFLMSEEYRESLKRRVLGGEAPHMEVLLHHYGFGKPKTSVEVSVPPGPPLGQLAAVMTKEELRFIYELGKRLRGLAPVSGRVVAREALPPAANDEALNERAQATTAPA